MKCHSELPLIEAAKLLVGVGKKNLIVVDNDNYVLGTISASDILRRFINSSKSIDIELVFSKILFCEKKVAVDLAIPN